VSPTPTPQPQSNTTPQAGINRLQPSLQMHLRLLLRLGLTPIPIWGQGKLFPGTRLRELAASPPSADEVLAAGYHGGLSILCGTQHPLGGFILGLDVDRGPAWWPNVPKGFLYAETGTALCKWHPFLRTVDRLDGQINLRDSQGGLVCEMKGAGNALRSWPTRPPEKPTGYTPYAVARDLAADPPVLTAIQVAEGMEDFLSQVLGLRLHLELQGHDGPGGARRRWVVGSSLAQRLEEALAARGTYLGPPKRGGWQQGRCPFHQDRSPSFSVAFELGIWRCWAGCGAGGLQGLAERLGLHVYRWRRGHPVLPPVEVTL
jgi:hypothetical protein